MASVPSRGRRTPRPTARRRSRPPNLTGLGARLREARDRAALSQTAVGAPHYTRAYVSAIELGKIQPSLRALAHLAARLGVGTEELLRPSSAVGSAQRPSARGS